MAQNLHTDHIVPKNESRNTVQRNMSSKEIVQSTLENPSSLLSYGGLHERSASNSLFPKTRSTQSLNNIHKRETSSRDSSRGSQNKWLSYDQCYKEYYLDGGIRDPYSAISNVSTERTAAKAPAKKTNFVARNKRAPS